MRQLTFSFIKNCKQKFWTSRLASSKSDHVQLKGDPNQVADSELVQVSCGWPAEERELRAAVLRDMRVVSDFITEEEEAALMAELQPYLAKMRYEFDHWDNAIHGYRETERSQWSPSNAALLERVRRAAFREDERPLPHHHVLDLAPNGHIKPHVDAVRFCGPVIAGLCLLSPAVMRLTHEQRADLQLDALLPARGLYVMRDSARYLFNHAILSSGCEWRGVALRRRRRVAVITRSAPAPL